MARALMLLLWLCAAPALAAPAGTAASFSAFAFDQRIGARLPDVVLTDAGGNKFALRDLRGGPPLLLVFAYHRCPNLCGLALAGIASSFDEAGLVAGRDYQLVVLSIDPADTVSDAQAAQQRYGASARGWHFAVGMDAVRALGAAAGVQWRWDDELQQFVHPAGLVVVAPDLRVASYLGGVSFEPAALRAALAPLPSRGFAPLLLCWGADPSDGRWSAAILTAVRVAAIATVLFGAAWLVRAVRR
jgi:protein SCO1/2